MAEPITDDQLRELEALADKHVVGRPLPIMASAQGMAVATLARSVPALLHEIAMSRQSEAALCDEVERLTARAEAAEAAVKRVRAIPALDLMGSYRMVSMKRVLEALGGE